MIEDKLRPLGTGLSFNPPRGRRCASLRIIQEKDAATSMPSGGAVPPIKEGADQGLRVRQVATVGKPEALMASLPGPGTPSGA